MIGAKGKGPNGVVDEVEVLKESTLLSHDFKINITVPRDKKGKHVLLSHILAHRGHHAPLIS